MNSGSSTSCSPTLSNPETPPDAPLGYYTFTVSGNSLALDLIALLTNAGWNIHDIRVPQEQFLRDIEIINKYLEDPKTNNTVALGEAYGLSRERICQILRPVNAIAYAAARRRAAEEEVHKQAGKLVEELQSKRQELIDQVKELVINENLSIRAALMKRGLPPQSSLSTLISAQLRAEGISTRQRRHDFTRTRRKEIVRKLFAEGYSIVNLVSKMRETDDPELSDKKISVPWVYNHMPEIRAHRKRRNGLTGQAMAYGNDGGGHTHTLSGTEDVEDAGSVTKTP